MDVLAGRTIAVVPLKALDQAKGRLAGDLPARDRRELVSWMLERVLAACREATLVDEVVVVAGDDEGMGLAAAAGVTALRESGPGLNTALALADTTLREAAATLVVAADLPLATGADLDAVIAAGAGRPAAVVVAPTADGGTAALYRRPPTAIATAYGAGSAVRHLGLAEDAGVPAVRLDVERLALDVDTPEQLAALRGGFPPEGPAA